MLVPYKNEIAIKKDGHIYGLGTKAIVLRPDKEGYVSTKGKWYHGKLLIKNMDGKLTVINDIELEDYIKGVVPSEMPPSWEFEALKAQAIAARSFALANLGKQAKHGYDLKDNTEDQAYGGASAETNITNKAVDETNGLVLTYDMKIISAYYTASAGGMTLTSSSVWGGYTPYLHSVPSFDDNVGKKGHGVGMSQHGANNLAKQGYNAYQILQYFYQNVKFAKLNNES
jgi:stage II sporulation protein D